MAPVSELVTTLVAQYCPNSNYAAGIAAAGAASHIAVRNIRACRRRMLRPIRLLGRVIRGLAVYAVVIAAGWIALTAGLPHLP
jgi:hypothetical protein